MLSFLFPVIFHWVLDLRFWWTEYNPDRFKVQIQPTVEFNSTQFKVQVKPTLQYSKEKMPEDLWSTLPRSCVRANRLSKTQSWCKFNFRFWNEFLFKHNCYFFWGRARSWGRKWVSVFVLLLSAPLSVDSRLNIVKYRKTAGAFLAG